MEPVKIDTAFESVTVDLWGHEFETVPLTRSKRSAYRGHMRQVAEAELTDDDDLLVASVGAALDVRLKVTDGKRTPPSKLIGERWESDQLTIEQLLGFLNAIATARPT